MAGRSPINVRELAKKGIFNEDRFYRLLSENCNYMDPKATKEFYLGLVRLVSSELRTNGVIRLPHLGDMALVALAPKVGLEGKVKKMMGVKYMLKFYIHYALKKYFSKYSEAAGENALIDPREKLLNQEVV